MPGFDRTGPAGAGPMTGGGFGRCTPQGRSMISNSGLGFGRGPGGRVGFGPGFGRGRGNRAGFGRRGMYDSGYGPAFEDSYALTPEEEASRLKADATILQNDLDEINRRIEELKKASQE